MTTQSQSTGPRAKSRHEGIIQMEAEISNLEEELRRLDLKDKMAASKESTGKFVKPSRKTKEGYRDDNVLEPSHEKLENKTGSKSESRKVPQNTVKANNDKAVTQGETRREVPVSSRKVRTSGKDKGKDVDKHKKEMEKKKKAENKESEKEAKIRARRTDEEEKAPEDGMTRLETAMRELEADMRKLDAALEKVSVLNSLMSNANSEEEHEVGTACDTHRAREDSKEEQATGRTKRPMVERTLLTLARSIKRMQTTKTRNEEMNEKVQSKMAHLAKDLKVSPKTYEKEKPRESEERQQRPDPRQTKQSERRSDHEQPKEDSSLKTGMLLKSYQPAITSGREAVRYEPSYNALVPVDDSEKRRTVFEECLAALIGRQIVVYEPFQSRNVFNPMVHTRVNEDEDRFEVSVFGQKGEPKTLLNFQDTSEWSDYERESRKVCKPEGKGKASTNEADELISKLADKLSGDAKIVEEFADIVEEQVRKSFDEIKSSFDEFRSGTKLEKEEESFAQSFNETLSDTWADISETFESAKNMEKEEVKENVTEAMTAFPLEVMLTLQNFFAETMGAYFEGGLPLFRRVSESYELASELIRSRTMEGEYESPENAGVSHVTNGDLHSTSESRPPRRIFRIEPIGDVEVVQNGADSLVLSRGHTISSALQVERVSRPRVSLRKDRRRQGLEATRESSVPRQQDLGRNEQDNVKMETDIEPEKSAKPETGAEQEKLTKPEKNMEPRNSLVWDSVSKEAEEAAKSEEISGEQSTTSKLQKESKKHKLGTSSTKKRSIWLSTRIKNFSKTGAKGKIPLSVAPVIPPKPLAHINDFNGEQNDGSNNKASAESNAEPIATKSNEKSEDELDTKSSARASESSVVDSMLTEDSEQSSLQSGPKVEMATLIDRDEVEICLDGKRGIIFSGDAGLIPSPGSNMSIASNGKNNISNIEKISEVKLDVAKKSSSGSFLGLFSYRKAGYRKSQSNELSEEIHFDYTNGRMSSGSDTIESPVESETSHGSSTDFSGSISRGSESISDDVGSNSDGTGSSSNSRASSDSIPESEDSGGGGKAAQNQSTAENQLIIASKKFEMDKYYDRRDYQNWFWCGTHYVPKAPRKWYTSEQQSESRETGNMDSRTKTEEATDKATTPTTVTESVVNAVDGVIVQPITSFLESVGSHASKLGERGTEYNKRELKNETMQDMNEKKKSLSSKRTREKMVKPEVDAE